MGLGVLFSMLIAVLVGFDIFVRFVEGTTYRHKGPDDGSTREIVLKTESRSDAFEPDRRPQRTWVLRVPKSYVVRERGTNWLGSYWVGLRMSYNIQTLELKPNPRSYTDETGWSEFFIDLHNKPFSHNTTPDVCYDYQDNIERGVRSNFPKLRVRPHNINVISTA